MSSVLHKRYGFMGNSSHLVSNEERREGKTVVSFLWLEICNIITVSLNSNRLLAFASQTLPLISLAQCGDIWLKVWTSVLEFVHRVYLFLTILYFWRLLQTGIYRCSPAAMIHAT